MLTTIIVNDPGDFIDSNPNITTLREAINIANDTLAPDIIKFDETEFAGGGTILLDQNLGELSITRSVTIDGTDTSGEPLGITIDAGNGTDGEFGTGDGIRIFYIVGDGSTLVTLNGLTLIGGDVPASGGRGESVRAPGGRLLALAA